MLAVAVMMNNYFHDVATALLASSAILMFAVLRTMDPDPSPETVRFVLRLYGWLSRVALVALVWILVGGIPRTIFFARLEWWDAAGKGIIPALVVKHVMMFVLVALGGVGWWRLRKRVAELRAGAELAHAGQDSDEGQHPDEYRSPPVTAAR